MTPQFETLQRRAGEKWAQWQDQQKPWIAVGTATCGRAAGAMQVLAALRQETKRLGLDCDFLEVGCSGACYAEPLVSVMRPDLPGICYGPVRPERVPELVRRWFAEEKVTPEIALGTLNSQSLDGVRPLEKHDFFRFQVRRTLCHCGEIDPTNIDHYLAHGGYSGLARGLTIGSENVIERIREAGLRGRGGAGFPTWKKWQLCRETSADRRYVVCNADEGDPGAFMNRSLIEGDPHLVLEGLIIAGYAIGASEAYIYCRAEYPLALERLRTAIAQAEAYGFLGENILDSGFSFRVRIKEGAGAFVCGEETALIASIEGRRGMPRPRPPYPATYGLWGKPTVINNVETLACVTQILQRGAEWFAQYGTPASKGTKTFSLVGKVKRTGLVEVPLGTTLRRLVYDIGGGILNDRSFKAVQIGGPSGGCIPAELLDTPIDYDSLQAAGTIMGSGGVVVMDERTCMVDFARYFLDFAQKESCGECPPCRLGNRQLLDILTDLTQGRGSDEDLALLEQLSEVVRLGSLCGLGKTTPNPVLSTLRYFRPEYQAHLEKVCPARSCKALIRFRISEICVGCMICADSCTANGVIVGEDRPQIDPSQCTRCGTCIDVCPQGAIVVE